MNLSSLRTIKNNRGPSVNISFNYSIDEIPGLERIIISEDYTINGQKCFKEHANEKEPVKDGHRMDHATCFQYYNPKILDYISSRI